MSYNEVFRDHEIYQMHNRMQELFYTELAHHRLPSLTRDTILKLMVRDEHRDILEQANNLCEFEVTNTGTSVTVGGMKPQRPNLLFEFKKPLDYMLPTYTKNGLIEEQAPEEYAKIMAWVERRYAMGRAYARARGVLQYLNRNLKTPPHVRYYFPGVLVLMAGNDYFAKLHTKLQAPRIPGGVPKLPPSIVAMCRDATKLLAKSTMFPQEKLENNDDVAISMNIGYIKAFTTGERAESREFNWDVW